MSEDVKTGSRLTIRSYPVRRLDYGTENRIDVAGNMTVDVSITKKLLENEPLVKKIDIRIILPNEHNQHTNTIMDVIPISAKALGKVGEGITHTLGGAYVLLTGIDEDGRQVCNIFREQLRKFNGNKCAEQVTFQEEKVGNLSLIWGDLLL